MTRLLVAFLLALAIGLLGLIAWPAVSAAADASPTPTLPALEEDLIDEDLIVAGDPRSEGEGPGIVGSPLAILFGVIVLGLATAGVTVVVVRMRGDPEAP